MKKRRLFVYFLPQQVPEADLLGSAAVVLDVLRATTTICQALASGAQDVVPFSEVQEVLAAAAHFQPDNIVLGGERGGRRIEGFDLGNSPVEYTPQVVRGRSVLITTTNGTRAFDRVRAARRVLVGALVNLSAVAVSIEKEPNVAIVCAGTDGGETGEDVLAAGALVARCLEAVDGWETNLMAQQAQREWEAMVARAAAAGRTLSDQLAIEFRDTPGGRNLREIGMDRDLADCARLDCLEIVPEWDRRTGRIWLSGGREPPR